MKTVPIISMTAFLSVGCILTAHALDFPWEKSTATPGGSPPAAPGSALANSPADDLAARAAAGEADAQNKYGEACRDGGLGLRRDPGIAFGWFTSAARLGHLGGQMNLV